MNVTYFDRSRHPRRLAIRGVANKWSLLASHDRVVYEAEHQNGGNGKSAVCRSARQVEG
jgi:hypothetical protein